MEVQVDSSGPECYEGLAGSASEHGASMRNLQRSRECPIEDGCNGVMDEVGIPKLDSYGPSTAALPRRAIFIYGTGHVLNDLTAACWFTYLLIFLTDIGLSPKQAGAVMLSGQLADGFATIVVGQLIDRFGHFKIWHAGGSILVAISFSLVFGQCIVCELFGLKSASIITMGYCTFAAIFNLGWAATQVSHMFWTTFDNMINTVRLQISNLFLYVVAYAVFWALPTTSVEGVRSQFWWITWIAIFTGICFVAIFLSGVREPKLHHHIQSSFKRISIMSWFRRPLYYQVALVYMLTRLTTNVSQAFLPFYLIEDLGMGASSKAVVPALIYICSFLASIALQELHWTGRRLKGVFTGGAGLWIISGAVIYFLPLTFKNYIYAAGGIIGLGNALMLVTATSMQGVLVGCDLSGCAFVYGSLSFLDKFTCGFVLYFIEKLNDETPSCLRTDGSFINCHESVIRLALGSVAGGCALLAAMITMIMDLGDVEAEISALHKPLLNTAEFLNQGGKDASVHQPALETENVGTTPVPIFPKRTGSACRNRHLTEATEDDVEIDSMPQEPTLTFWKMLESAMVGRAGSIRKPVKTWLE